MANSIGKKEISKYAVLIAEFLDFHYLLVRRDCGACNGSRRYRGGGVTGSILYHVAWAVLSRRKRFDTPGYADFFRTDREAVGLIVKYMGLYGVGQIYGRFGMFAIGALFSGPLAAFVVYSKQVFNALGLVGGITRRVELTHAEGFFGEAFSLQLVRASIFIQASGIWSVQPRHHLCGFEEQRWLGCDVTGVSMASCGKVVKEAMSATFFSSWACIGWPTSGATAIILIGLIGLGLAWEAGSLLIYVLLETVAYLAYLGFWWRLYEGYTRSGPKPCVPNSYPKPG